MTWKQRLRGRLANGRAKIELALFRPEVSNVFWIVSTARNCSEFIDRHLDSIAAQRFDPARIHHLVIDDASTDATGDRVRRRIESGAGYDLAYRRNDVQLGGCANLTAGFRAAVPGSIVLQVDADDWLPDPDVLAYLDMRYHDPDLWMTYNSWVSPDGRALSNSHPIPRDVVRGSTFRDYAWVTSHLHSFRRELFSHVKDESLVDPVSNEFWTAAVDMSHYFPMLELAGHHAQHVRRTTYVYNLHQGSLFQHKRPHQLDCERRIRALPRYSPLGTLESNSA